MINRDEIISILQKEGINHYETEYCGVDLTLKSDNIHELIKLAKDNEIKSIFFAYKVPDKDNFMLTDGDKLARERNEYDYYEEDSLIEETAYQEYEKYFEKQKEIWNLRLSKLNFLKPTNLCIYCLLNGIRVGIIQFDPWTNSLPNKNDILNELDSKLYTMLENANQQHKNKRQEILNMIYNHLDSSTEMAHMYKSRTPW